MTGYHMIVLGLSLSCMQPGCSGGGKTTHPDVNGLPSDATADIADGAVETVKLPDVRYEPGGKDLPFSSEVLHEAVAEILDLWEPQPCQSHDDCDEGFCVEFPPGGGDFFCAPPCIEECPGDWVCKSVYLEGPDPVSVCLPPGDTICKVCDKKEDCLLAGSLCVMDDGPYGYCGKVCDPLSAKCPQGFQCLLYGPDVEDPQGFQCLPEPGSCCVAGQWADCDDANPCTLDLCSPSLGCLNEPLEGKCEGPDPCLSYACEDGACSGTALKDDVTLDGIDDDCDGSTDEDAYKGFGLAGWSYVGTGSAMASADVSVTLYGSLSASPWVSTGSSESCSLTSGLYSVWGAVKQ